MYNDNPARVNPPDELSARRQKQLIGEQSRAVKDRFLELMGDDDFLCQYLPDPLKGTDKETEFKELIEAIQSGDDAEAGRIIRESIEGEAAALSAKWAL